jgi:HEAT repeat protein
VGLKDRDSRIRREAIKGLAAYKDPKLDGLFVKIINTDPSYFAIAEAARALGQSGSPQAYDVLAGALKLESWQGTIRAGVLGGFAALKDPRALEAGLKYATPANPASLRNAAFQILGEAGKGNDRALETLLSVLKEKLLQTRFNALHAIGKLGDQRAIPALEELAKSSDIPAFGKQIITGAINQIKNPKKEGQKEN